MDNWTQKPLFLARTLGDMEWVVRRAHIEKLSGVAITELPCPYPGWADWPQTVCVRLEMYQNPKRHFVIDLALSHSQAIEWHTDIL